MDKYFVVCSYVYVCVNMNRPNFINHNICRWYMDLMHTKKLVMVSFDITTFVRYQTIRTFTDSPQKYYINRAIQWSIKLHGYNIYVCILLYATLCTSHAVIPIVLSAGIGIFCQCQNTIKNIALYRPSYRN